MIELTREECQNLLKKANDWKEYYKYYTYIGHNVPTTLRLAKSWAQIESFPHLMIQLMENYKGLRYWNEKGFI